MRTNLFRMPASALATAGLAFVLFAACSATPPMNSQTGASSAPSEKTHGGDDLATAASSTPAGRSDSGKAAASILQVSVKGMSCPQCAYNINQQLYRLPGVADVIVDLGEGLVTAKLSGEARPTKNQVDYAIRLAGFTPDRIEFK